MFAWLEFWLNATTSDNLSLQKLCQKKKKKKILDMINISGGNSM